MADISKWDRRIVPGCIIRAYRKGIHRVTRIERRFVTKEDAKRFPAVYPNAGDEYNPLIHYIPVLNSNLKKAGGKQECSCDAGYCVLLDPKELQAEADKEIKAIQDGYKQLIDLAQENKKFL